MILVLWSEWRFKLLDNEEAFKVIIGQFLVHL